jgi:hypothetical protein
MTLIVGLNLSNRLYVAGDTRVTFSDDSFKDDIIKVVNLCGESSPAVEGKNPNAICIAVAGDLALANFLQRNIRSALKTGLLPTDIRDLSSAISDFVRDQMDEWLKKHPYRPCCMIFGGMTMDRKKKISLENLEKLKEILKRNIAPQEELDEVKSKLEKDPFFQELAKRIPRERLMRPFEEPDAMVVNPLIEKAAEAEQDFIDAPDSLVFGVQVGRSGVSIEFAEWGEVLAYGTGGLSKDDLPEDFLAMMELSTGQLVNEEDLMEAMHVRDYILKVAKDRSIKEIGGAVTPMVLRDCLFKIQFGYSERALDGEILETMYPKNGQIFFYKKGKPEIQMKWFPDYRDGSGKAEL